MWIYKVKLAMNIVNWVTSQIFPPLFLASTSSWQRIPVSQSTSKYNMHHVNKKDWNEWLAAFCFCFFLIKTLFVWEEESYISEHIEKIHEVEQHSVFERRYAILRISNVAVHLTVLLIRISWLTRMPPILQCSLYNLSKQKRHCFLCIAK